MRGFDKGKLIRRGIGDYDAGEAGKAGTVGDVVMTGRAGVVGKAETAGKAGIAGKAGTTGDAELAGRAGLAGKAGTVGETGMAGNAELAGKAGEAGAADEAEVLRAEISNLRSQLSRAERYYTDRLILSEAGARNIDVVLALLPEEEPGLSGEDYFKARSQRISSLCADKATAFLFSSVGDIFSHDSQVCGFIPAEEADPEEVFSSDPFITGFDSDL